MSHFRLSNRSASVEELRSDETLRESEDHELRQSGNQNGTWYNMYTLEPDIWSTALLNKLELQNLEAIRTNYPTRVDISEVKKALYYCKKYHGDQKRDSGEPYYSHPITVANMVSDCIFKTDVIVASILHDTVEDTDVTVEIIKNEFGDRVAEMVERLTRVKLGEKITAAEILELAHKVKDDEVMIIKLLDRIHNMETIGAKSPEKRRKIINETLVGFLSFAAYIEEYRALLDLLIKLSTTNSKNKVKFNEKNFWDDHYLKEFLK